MTREATHTPHTSRTYRSRYREILRFRSFSLALLGVLVLLLGLGMGCSSGGEHEHDVHPPKDLFGTMIQPMISCQSRTDTGYVSGKAFTITVVTVDGKPVERATANAYYVMQQAAAKSGVQIRVVSGFRTMAEQQYLYNCYLTKRCNNGNLAARPGYSNHQSGHALDLNTSASGVYNWLSKHGGNYGFKRTVPSEAWHWEWWGGGPGGGPCQSTCTPRCTGKSTFIGKDCKTGDCAPYGALCTNDNLGLRCYSVFCPALGKKDVCVNEQKGSCQDGKITLTSCGKDKTCHGDPSVRCVGVKKPLGTLQQAGCTAIQGWAYDPDQPGVTTTVKISVHGPDGDKNATAFDVKADQHDEALCKSIGSCKHAFSSRIPRSLLDGKPHPLYAYTYDSETKERVSLSASPKTLQCPYIPPQGVLRHVQNPTSFTAWRFSGFWDVLPVLDTDLTRLERGEPLPEKPVLVQADDKSPEVWLVDGGTRRHIPNPAALSAWRWTAADIQTWPASKVQALQLGLPWPQEPLLVQGGGPAIFMLDLSASSSQEPPAAEETNSSPTESSTHSETTEDGGAVDSSAHDPDPQNYPDSDPELIAPDTTSSQVDDIADNSPSSTNGAVLVIDGGNVLTLPNPTTPPGCGCQTSSTVPPLGLLFFLGCWLVFFQYRTRRIPFSP